MSRVGLPQLAALAAGAVALAGAGAGCGTVGRSPAGSSEPAAAVANRGRAGGSGGTLVIGMTAANIPALDTELSGGQGYEGIRFVGNQLYDALTRHDLKQSGAIPRLEPGLATSWRASPDATRWTFTLRDGVRFTDGTPWNADAAIFNLTRFTDPRSPYTTAALVGQAATYLSSVRSFKKIDDRTIEIDTRGPNSHLPEDLATVFFGSPTAIKQDPSGFNNAPVGTGPFEFASESTGQELTMRRNRDYWGGAAKLDELVLKPIPDATARIAALRSSSVNWIEYPTPDDIAGLQKGGFQVLTNSYDHVWPWVLNTASGPMKDVRVRQAINYAIDRRAMASSLLYDTAEPAYQVAPRANSAYSAANDVYRDDPAKARQLLAAAGYPNGFSLTVEYPTSGSGNMIPAPMNEDLQQDLASVGVRVRLMPIEWAAMLTQYVTGRMPAGVDAINISLSFMQESFWAQSFMSASPLNVGRYRDPKVDALLAKAQTVVDPAARGKVYGQAARYISRDAPWLFVVNDRNPRALAPNVHGFVEPKSWFVDLTDTWVGN
ncbi:MAG TPA: ABC transporter substrate-binding protein [Conexibacter sp.]